MLRKTFSVICAAIETWLTSRGRKTCSYFSHRSISNYTFQFKCLYTKEKKTKQAKRKIETKSLHCICCKIVKARSHLTFSFPSTCFNSTPMVMQQLIQRMHYLQHNVGNRCKVIVDVDADVTCITYCTVVLISVQVPDVLKIVTSCCCCFLQQQIPSLLLFLNQVIQYIVDYNLCQQLKLNCSC